MGHLRGRTARRVRGPAAILAALLIAATSACGDDPVADPHASTPAPEVDPSAESTGTTEPADLPARDLDVSVGRSDSLSTTCWGEGSPVVLYLHGLIQPADSLAWAHAPELGDLLAPETTYCEYERRNVGTSATTEGPIPFTETVADLDAVVDAVADDAPVVLLGGSFGGLLAATYAGTHPDRVAGVVMLDPTLPDERALERAYLPRTWWLTEDSWTSSAEKIDVYGAYGVAREALPDVPAVPGTIVVTKKLWGPPGRHAEAFRRGVRDQQADLVGRFTPHRTLTVDAPHAMVPVVPDEIAAAVLEVVSAGR